MEKITLIIMIKEGERGLLSIAENIVKSMIPILGEARLIDFYLYPAKLNNHFKLLINIKNDSIEIKDYVGYHYSDYPVKVLMGDNLFDNLLKIVGREKSPILILRADGFLYCNWDSFIDELVEFRGNNKIIFYTQGNDVFEALFIDNRVSFYDLLKVVHETKNVDNQSYDEIWKNLISISENNFNREKIKSIESYQSLKTVKEYYDFHINLLNDIEKCYKYASLFYDKALKEKDDITVTSESMVKNSYISSSSYIEGEVEKSFIFSNVKISKRAYIYKSVIMNNNNIAENARLERLVLCDGGELLQTVLPRISEKAVLGGRSESGKNRDFPDYIYGGISLIGSNMDIPRGFEMAENCYISSNTGRLILKEKKKLSNGESLIS